MVVTNLKSKPVHIWVPPIYSADPKITVTRADTTVDDISDILMDLSIENGATNGIGIFKFKIPNASETYTGVWNPMDIFKYYCDYEGAPGTTLQFRGRIEKVSYKENYVECTGKSESMFVQNRTVNKDYIDKDAGYMIKDLFDSYGESRFDTTEINVSTGITLTLNFAELPFWEAIEAICYASGYDCYISAGLVVKFFEQESITNTTEGIVHDFNLIEVGDFSADSSVVKNQVRVVGGTVDGVQVTYTAKDTASQTSYGIRTHIINDDGITSLSAARELADYTLAESKNPPLIGEVKGLLLASIQPGEKIKISSPLDNLPPAYYRIISYKHTLNDRGRYTTVNINREPLRLSHVIKDGIQREHKRTDASINPESFDFCEIELFNSNIGTHSNTTITDGVLKLSSGASTGFWTSSTYTTANSSNISSTRIGLVGDNLPGVVISISADGGNTFEVCTRDVLKSIVNQGSTFIIKLTFSDTSSQVDSLSVQYSTV